MNILQLYNNRKMIARRLVKAKSSSSRSLLIRLLKMKRRDLLLTIADTYFQVNYGVRPMGTEVEIPKLMMPEFNFQFISDELKKSISSSSVFEKT